MRKPDIQLFPLDQSPGRQLHRAHLAMRSGLLRTLKESGFDLTIEEWVVLSALWDHGEVSQRELGERVGKDRHFVSRLLDGLEKRQLVERRGVKGDRRVNHIQLTAAGESAKAILTASLTDYLHQIFGDFTHEEYETFLRGLDKLVAWHDAQHARGDGEPLPTVLPKSNTRTRPDSKRQGSE